MILFFATLSHYVAFVSFGFYIILYLSIVYLYIYIYTLIILYDMISAWRTFNAVDPVPGMSTCRIWAWRVLLSFVQSKAAEELLSALLDCISRTPQQ